ncbi:hypothetical protein BC833DRAFT_601562 [Globomyces pollinis-pini]|nr:hypothetical protein BC833DRAFT_601562 [Globomyces pollinis-pini]
MSQDQEKKNRFSLPIITTGKKSNISQSRSPVRSKFLEKMGLDSVISDIMSKINHDNRVTQIATKSYDHARQQCIDYVTRISEDCRAHNTRYRDRSFDLSSDPVGCIVSFGDEISEEKQQTLDMLDIKRVPHNFEKPVFVNNGVTEFDIKQGSVGDCWFLTALAIISEIPNLIQNLIVAKDEVVGVYGFIFFRDGEWVPTIVDDQLFIKNPTVMDGTGLVDTFYNGDQKLFKKCLGGGNSLYYSRCRDPNETWLPLLEKAYAKAHGDYDSIEGGFTGEGVEDLTGGVMVNYIVEDIIDLEKFWKTELMYCNQDRLFACSINSKTSEHQGLVHGHAYGILKCVEVKGKRFLLIKNPWGQTEWNGRWSDGSAEWTPEWMTALNHTFGDDGAFWMEYCDFVQNWTRVDKIRLFDQSWSLNSQWLEVHPTFPSAYGICCFKLTITQPTPVVLALSKSDTRYFKSLSGILQHYLSFEVYKEGETKYFTKNRTLDISEYTRSVACEIDRLEIGVYYVVVKIDADKHYNGTNPMELIANNIDDNLNKFQRMALSYEHARSRAANYQNTGLLELGRQLCDFPFLTIEQSFEQMGLKDTIASIQNRQIVMDRKVAITEASSTKPVADDGDGDYEDVEDEVEEEEITDEEETELQNAIADRLSSSLVIGLRVYSKDSKMELEGLIGQDCMNLPCVKVSNQNILAFNLF